MGAGKGVGRRDLSRREFVGRALSLGIVGAAGAALGPPLVVPRVAAWASDRIQPAQRARAWIVNAGSPVIQATFEQPSTIGRAIVSLPLFNVKGFPYYARGDGSADDGPPIQAAINDAAAAGGGIVYLPPGTFLLANVQEQYGVRFYLLDYYSGVHIVGAGRHVSMLVARPGLPDQTRIISAHSADRTSLVSGNLFQDFTVQGNAARQPDAGSMVGISNVNTDSVHHVRMRVESIKATAASEGACYDSYDSMRNGYRDCEAVQDGIGSLTGSGFSATRSTATSYQHCRAAGSGKWMGFTTFLSSKIEYRDCSGFANGQRGLNCERSEAVRYLDCRAGGRTTGNRGDGIYLYQSLDVEVTDCRSQGNQSGLVNNGSTLRVIRGQYTDNADAGLAFSSDADWANSSLEEAPAISGNARAPIAVSGLLLTTSSASQ